MGVTWNGIRRGPKRAFVACKNTALPLDTAHFNLRVSPMEGNERWLFLVLRQVYYQQESGFRKWCSHFHTHLDFYWSICRLHMERKSQEQIQDKFCIFPVISTIKHWTFDDIFRICAVCRLTRSVHKCIQTCQFVSSFYAPSCELAHNRLVECVQLICPFV